jgi:glutamyl-tRNA reductase
VQIVIVGLNHKSAPLDLLDRVAVTPERRSELLATLREHVAETLVLSTCNRVELYAWCGHEESGTELLRRALATRGGLDPAAVRDATYALGHRAAVSHALRVASGLDSMVLGESEIQGQVRRALDTARHERTLGPMLDRLGSAALACGKRVRSETAIANDGASMASIGLRVAEQRLGTLNGSRVVVLGAGEIAARVVADLVALAPAKVTILSRTPERAAALAISKGIEARLWNQLAPALADADLVVACTSARTPVLDASVLAAARAGSSQRPLVCVDLGVPRDIAPGVGDLPGVTLLDVGHLDATATECRVAHTREVTHARRIVAEETERYMTWWHGRGVASTVARLHAHASAVCDAELERALARLPELSPQDHAVVREAVARVAAKLLHQPTLALKSDPEGANMALVVERLFALAPAAARGGEPEAEPAFRRAEARYERCEKAAT